MIQQSKNNKSFFLAIFLFIVSCIFSSQTAFAYSPVHIHKGSGNHVSNHGHIHLIPEVIEASDTSYDQDLYFNEDDEHKNGKNILLSFESNFFLSNNQSLDKTENNTEALFAQQVHADYLLEEKSSQKTTTSQ